MGLEADTVDLDAVRLAQPHNASNPIVFACRAAVSDRCLRRALAHTPSYSKIRVIVTQVSFRVGFMRVLKCQRKETSRWYCTRPSFG